MLYSQNGYQAKDTSLLATYTVPGSGGIKATLRKGDVSVVLLYLMEEFHKTVQPLRKSDTGSYNPRSIVGGEALSNHASGTAVDLRWRDHVLGKTNTYTAKQEAALRKILNFLGGVVRWGGDYKGRKDEMHFEINASMAAVSRVADKIRGVRAGKVAHVSSKKATPTFGVLQKGSKGEYVRQIQRDMNRIFPAYKDTPLTVDGIFGDHTVGAVKEFQRRAGLVPDGIVGPRTKAAFRRYGITVRG